MTLEIFLCTERVSGINCYPDDDMTYSLNSSVNGTSLRNTHE